MQHPVATARNKKPRSRGAPHFYNDRSLFQLEINALFDRMIVALQCRNRGELSVHVLRIPVFTEGRSFFSLHELILNRLREHALCTPAPHFFSACILHDEIMCLSVSKTKLDHFLSVIANVELEL